jgi:RimJ/RimL family protein N-acetyltransferase
MSSQIASTELLTDRLQLRWMTADDAAFCLSMWNDPDFIRHVGDRGIRTLEQAAEAMQSGMLKLYRDVGYGPYLLARKEGGPPLGLCGLFKRENLDHPDIGYALLPEYCGSGYAFEAAAAVMQHAREKMKLPCLKAIVSPGHSRSIRLLEKLGMHPERPVRMPGEDEDVLLYSIELTARDGVRGN